jgi:D-alanine-D-alanine ligase-like ATP-grasp enzyme
MRICVLDDSYEQSGTPFKQFDFLPDPIRYLAGHECERHFLHKATAVKQILQLSKRGFDLFLNLCDGAWEEDRPGIEVVQALERLQVPFTGATSSFYEPSRETMKKVCHYSGIKTPAYVLASEPGEVEWAAQSLKFPLIVKHPNGYASIGITKSSRVETPDALRAEAAKTIDAFGAALIEEFVDGREFTVLVAENPEDEFEPIAYHPVEFRFPRGESFKHFDLKWKDYKKMKCVPCDDPDLACRLKNISKNFFLGLAGTGYGRCDIRMNKRGDLFMLEINPNCELFYPPDDAGSADFILMNDPGGHQGFVDGILKVALKRNQRQTRKWKMQPRPHGDLGMYASQAIEPGEIIDRYEEQPHALVTKTHVLENWNPEQQRLFARYAYPVTDETYIMWSGDPEDWRPINHSCDPNAWLEGLNLTARRRITAGEQITMDYGTFCNESLESFSCDCGSPECRGVIRGTDYLETFIERYGEHVSDYVRTKRSKLRATVRRRSLVRTSARISDR